MASVVTPTARSRFLEMSAIATLRHRRFAPRGRIEGMYSGRHRSRQQGGASEFVDFREYAAGEDLRRLDWKVLARTGKPFVRLYQDETDLSCTMVIDASASMNFAGRAEKKEQSKLAYTQFLATAISQLIYDQRDRVGLAVAARDLFDLHTPAGTAGHVSRVQQSIESIRTATHTDLATPLRTLFSRLSRRGVLMVMSDFLVDDIDAVFASLRLFRHNKWEVVAMHIIHPEEERLPDGLAYRFEGMEDDGVADCSPTDVRQAYEEAFKQHASRVRGAAVAAGCDYRRVSTATPYMHTLGEFLIEANG